MNETKNKMCWIVELWSAQINKQITNGTHWIYVYRPMRDRSEWNERNRTNRSDKLYRRRSNHNISARDFVLPFYQQKKCLLWPSTQLRDSLEVFSFHKCTRFLNCHHLPVDEAETANEKKKKNEQTRCDEETIHSRAAGIVCKETCRIEKGIKTEWRNEKTDVCAVRANVKFDASRWPGAQPHFAWWIAFAICTHTHYPLREHWIH